jgi:putative hydrolase of the HAD superfamily
VRFKAVLFDLWGTLVPLPKPLRYRATEAVAAALNVPLDKWVQAWVATRIERETGDLVTITLRVCRDLGIDADEGAVANALARRITIQREAFGLIQPDVVPTLRALRENGLSTGLISNCTSDLPRHVKASPLAPVLDVCVYSCNERVMKPDARLYLAAAERLRVTPEECLYVGDGGDGELPGAERAGMTAVLLRAADTPQPDWRGHRISVLSEVPRLLATLAG